MTEVFVEITQRRKPSPPPWSEEMLVSHITRVDGIPLRDLLGTRDGGLSSDVPASLFNAGIAPVSSSSSMAPGPRSNSLTAFTSTI